jgi:alkylation response protein AidB-like acyl-CoA dehydrogenase
MAPSKTARPASEGFPLDLALSIEQRLLQESVAQLVGTARDKRLHPDQQWKMLSDLGWLGLPFVEQYGGQGCGPIELCLVIEGLAYANFVPSFVPTVVIGASLISRLGNESQKRDLLSSVGTGNLRLALAQAAIGTHAIEATSSRGGWKLNGAVAFAAGGGDADAFLVSAHIGGGDGEIGMFVVTRNRAGLTVDRYETLDGGNGADLRLTDVFVDADSRMSESGVEEAIDSAMDDARLAMCFDAVGCASAMLDMTVAYTKERKQFGQPLAALQVVRHKLADMHVACVEARMISLRAAILSTGPERECAIAMAKYRALTAARAVAEQAVQLHGAMGVTEELPIGRYFRRILADEMMFGAPDTQLRRYSALRRLAAMSS